MKINRKRVIFLVLLCAFALSACGAERISMSSLLFEWDDIQELELFYMGTPIYELYVGTTEEEQDAILNELYKADLSSAVEAEDVETDSPTDMIETLRYWKIKTNGAEKEINIMAYKDSQYLMIRKGQEETLWKIPGDTFDFKTLRQLTTDIWYNTEDPDNSGRVSMEGKESEIKVTKENAAYAMFHMDHVIAEKGAMEFDKAVEADITLYVGDVIYSIERSTGRFCRQNSEAVACGQLDEQTLGSVEVMLLGPAAFMK